MRLSQSSHALQRARRAGNEGAWSCLSVCIERSSCLCAKGANHPSLGRIHTLILHLRTAFKARALGMQFDDDAVAADIRQFFNRPIPRSVWERSKVFQDADFVAFVERSIEPRDVGKRVA